MFLCHEKEADFNEQVTRERQCSKPEKNDVKNELHKSKKERRAAEFNLLAVDK